MTISGNYKNRNNGVTQQPPVDKSAPAQSTQPQGGAQADPGQPAAKAKDPKWQASGATKRQAAPAMSEEDKKNWQAAGVNGDYFPSNPNGGRDESFHNETDGRIGPRSSAAFESAQLDAQALGYTGPTDGNINGAFKDWVQGAQEKGLPPDKGTPEQRARIGGFVDSLKKTSSGQARAVSAQSPMAALAAGTPPASTYGPTKPSPAANDAIVKGLGDQLGTSYKAFGDKVNGMLPGDRQQLADYIAGGPPPENSYQKQNFESLKGELQGITDKRAQNSKNLSLEQNKALDQRLAGVTGTDAMKPIMAAQEKHQQFESKMNDISKQLAGPQTNLEKTLGGQNGVGDLGEAGRKQMAEALSGQTDLKDDVSKGLANSIRGQVDAIDKKRNELLNTLPAEQREAAAKRLDEEAAKLPYAKQMTDAVAQGRQMEPLLAAAKTDEQKAAIRTMATKGFSGDQIAALQKATGDLTPQSAGDITALQEKLGLPAKGMVDLANGVNTNLAGETNPRTTTRDALNRAAQTIDGKNFSSPQQWSDYMAQGGNWANSFLTLHDSRGQQDTKTVGSVAKDLVFRQATEEAAAKAIAAQKGTPYVSPAAAPAAAPLTPAQKEQREQELPETPVLGANLRLKPGSPMIGVGADTGTLASDDFGHAVPNASGPWFNLGADGG